MGKDHIKLRVIYKSGTAVEFTCDGYEVTRNRGTQEINGYKFEGVVRPKPAYFGLGEVESIWEID